VCESLDHFVAQCSNHKDKESANMNISEAGGTSGYNILFPTIISIFIHLNCGLTRGLIFMYVLTFLYFLLIRLEGLPPC
jgi:accessory gene regulator protein AgrB